jgi:SAM-dependent methyltransferase
VRDRLSRSGVNPRQGQDSPSTSEQTRLNIERWSAGEHVDVYANRSLAPVEVLILVRYREALSGRVIEVGCGAGRVLGYLERLGRAVYGVDVSPAMVNYCRLAYPGVDVRVGDIRALGGVVEGPFDVIFAANNLLDVLDDAGRRSVLRTFHGLLAPDGVLIFSSHNLAYAERHKTTSEPAPGQRRAFALLARALQKPPADVARRVVALPRRIRNRRRLAPLEHRADGYALINDETLDYSLLHYYIGRDDQARQLTEVGYRLVECLGPDGNPVAPGETGDGPWLHYIARPM